MPITMAQSVSTPGNVTPGGTIQPADVSTLYSALGSFSASELLFGLILAQTATDDTEYTVATGATRDWTIAPPTGAPAPTANNTIIAVLPFKWSSASAPNWARLQLRVNATEVTDAANMIMSSNAAGSGLLLAIVAGHDATYARTAMMFAMESNATGTLKTAFANADVPNAAVTSIGMTVGGTAGSFTFKRVRIWRMN